MVYIVATCILESHEDPRWDWAQGRQPVPVGDLPTSAKIHLRRCSIMYGEMPGDMTCHVVASTGVRFASFSVAF
jgi:hypothetical protein